MNGYNPSYNNYFKFYNEDKTVIEYVFWGRKTPFRDVIKAMERKLGEGVEYEYQLVTEIADVKFD